LRESRHYSSEMLPKQIASRFKACGFWSGNFSPKNLRVWRNRGPYRTLWTPEYRLTFAPKAGGWAVTVTADLRFAVRIFRVFFHLPPLLVTVLGLAAPFCRGSAAVSLLLIGAGLLMLGLQAIMISTGYRAALGDSWSRIEKTLQAPASEKF